jgi:hypothetical protein
MAQLGEIAEFALEAGHGIGRDTLENFDRHRPVPRTIERLVHDTEK